MPNVKQDTKQQKSHDLTIPALSLSGDFLGFHGRWEHAIAPIRQSLQLAA